MLTPRPFPRRAGAVLTSLAALAATMAIAPNPVAADPVTPTVIDESSLNNRYVSVTSEGVLYENDAGQIVHYDIDDGSRDTVVSDNDPQEFDVLPDRIYRTGDLLYGATDGKLKLVDIETGAQVAVVERAGVGGSMTGISRIRQSFESLNSDAPPSKIIILLEGERSEDLSERPHELYIFEDDAATLQTPVDQFVAPNFSPIVTSRTGEVVYAKLVGGELSLWKATEAGTAEFVPDTVDFGSDFSIDERIWYTQLTTPGDPDGGYDYFLRAFGAPSAVSLGSTPDRESPRFNQEGTVAIIGEQVVAIEGTFPTWTLDDPEPPAGLTLSFTSPTSTVTESCKSRPSVMRNSSGLPVPSAASHSRVEPRQFCRPRLRSSAILTWCSTPQSASSEVSSRTMLRTR